MRLIKQLLRKLIRVTHLSNMSIIYPKGIYFNKPREGAPDFVRGSLSFKVEDAVLFLKEHVNQRGYVNIDMLQGNDGLYLKLNTWKPDSSHSKPSQPQNAPVSNERPTPREMMAQGFKEKEEISLDEISF